jgi:hypothetical protein
MNAIAQYGYYVSSQKFAGVPCLFAAFGLTATVLNFALGLGADIETAVSMMVAG